MSNMIAPSGIVTVWYTDDTLIFVQGNHDQIMAMKNIAFQVDHRRMLIHCILGIYISFEIQGCKIIYL